MGTVAAGTDQVNRESRVQLRGHFVRCEPALERHIFLLLHNHHVADQKKCRCQAGRLRTVGCHQPLMLCPAHVCTL